MRKRHDINVLFYREGEQWVAQALTVDVATSGDSLDEARAAIQEALELYFEDTDETAPMENVRLETVVV